MAYFGLITRLQNCRKDENSDRLYLADCFNEAVATRVLVLSFLLTMSMKYLAISTGRMAIR